MRKRFHLFPSVAPNPAPPSCFPVQNPNLVVMKFKEGDWVEVFSRNEEPYGSWFPSKVLSVDVDKCAVSCELSATPDGRPMIEKVHERDVRPCPPHAPGTEHWMVGDIVEVFDAHSWRVGKIAKVLNDDYVVTKIFGSIQLKEFHASNLRSRRAWQNNHWVMINKIDFLKSIEHFVVINECELFMAQ
ncbi:Ribosomal protein L4/L1 family, partial [Musa troglodytarum]